MKALCLSVFSLALDISGLLPPARAAVLAAVCSGQLWACQGCLLLLTAHLLSVCDFGPVFAVLVSLLTLLTAHQAQTDLVFSHFPGDGSSVPRTDSELL